ncbi:autophagy-related 17 isoform X2 [Megalopta genalis]|uniref:autophagy-related 17 isoform X2 n=1 Tax=Megalopta genalis TaxID=115081 RepID=UPI003FD00D18
MLYIFHVDTGTTITFNIKLALQTVSQLMEAIERECGVLAVHQVLLMSGGETLEPNARVCSYSAGTDTNPIYLFSKAAIESQVPPTPSIYYGTDVDLQNQVEASLAMPATYQTLVARAQLAQQCCGLAGGQTKICEKLVHDQHLQQQGWAAVVANLEDITQMFQNRAALIQQSLAVYLTERQQHMELLASFNADLNMLSKIPILPTLRAQAEGLLSPEDKPEKEVEGQKEICSLLRWISAKDNQSSLGLVAEQCSKGLEQFDERVMEALKSEVNVAIDGANKQDMKEIKGLGERLFALEQLMQQTKKIVQDQTELAQGFQQNQNRASNLGDASVLPDLCASHRRQLQVMMQNHNQLRDIRRRCTKAKEELSVNIYYRLKWIMYVENKMMMVDSKLMMYNESLKRLRRHLEVLQQIHMAPQMYMNAVAEVVRRRTFSQAFLMWASNLACQLLTVHSEELARRREFQSKFDGHFLNTLFPGLEDTPPPFATQAPSVFDSQLPKLTVEDMELLRTQLPDLALTVSSPDLNTITRFFLSKSFTDAGTGETETGDKSSVNVDTGAKELELARAPMMSDRGGFESETDTEEFEKIRQDATDSKPESFDGAKQMRQKQLEVGASRSVSPSSSTSTNVSPLNSKVADQKNRASSTNEPGSFHFPNLSISERPAQLSPLTECAENAESSCLLHRAATGLSKYSEQPTSTTAEELSSLSPNPSSLTRSVLCDGQQHHLHQQQQQQQQRHQLSSSGGSSPSVGVGGGADFMGTEFYMDESLPSSLSEHPVDGQHQAIISLLQENLGNTRDEVERLRSILRTMKAAMNEAVSSVRQELLILRNQSNEDKTGLGEMTDRIREALSLYSNECDRRLREREQEMTVDHELEMADMKKLIQSREEEICTLKRSLMEKETELSEHERLTATIRQKLESGQNEMRNLNTRLHQQLDEALEQGCAAKASAERFQDIASLTSSMAQCRDRIQELESTLSTARSDQQRLVDATDMLHMGYQSQLDLTEGLIHNEFFEKVKESYVAIRTAVEKERGASRKQVELELQMVRHVVDENEQEVKMYRMREFALQEELEQYKTAIKRVTKSEEFKDVPEEMSLSHVQEVLKCLRSGKDEVEVSESKKVRLEANDDQSCLTRRLETLENDNKRLSLEMESLREYKAKAKTKIEGLKADKLRMEMELVMLRTRRFTAPAETSSSSSEGREREMIGSVAVLTDGVCRDAATSTETQCTCPMHCGNVRRKMKKYAEKLVQQGCITVNSCDPGDKVLVYWNPIHENFTLYQESAMYYFLNADCIPELNLGSPKKLHTVVEVVDKDYCQAKKSENRFHVPHGTKFYRVRVKAIAKSRPMMSSMPTPPEEPIDSYLSRPSGNVDPLDLGQNLPEPADASRTGSDVEHDDRSMLDRQWYRPPEPLHTLGTGDQTIREEDAPAFHCDINNF